MTGFSNNIERLTLENEDFRRVLYTGKHMQLVLMSIPVGGEIGEETHAEVDQFLRIEAGAGKLIIDGAEHALEDGSAIVVPAGARHNVVNTGQAALKLYSLYAPPNHLIDIVHKTKADADQDEARDHWDGSTSE